MVARCCGRMTRMSSNDGRIEVVCSCCGAKLSVESTTGLVVKAEAKKIDYSIEEGMKREADRKNKADDLFQRAFDNEKQRASKMEEKFRQALKSKDELPDPKRPFDWD